MALLVLLVSFLSSTVGAICGVGGGIFMKPVLDLFGMADVSTISFLSGCTVLSMSLFSVGGSMLARENTVALKTGTPLALGAALGGVIGRQLFTAVKNSVPDPDMVGGVQAGCLAVITVGTLVYTLQKERVLTHRLKKAHLCAGIGAALGIVSSFLGIGGGPINMVVLHYFFSMPTKDAAQNSLYIICISQLAGLAATLATGTVPAFEWSWLVLMAAGGIGGAAMGRRINKGIDGKQTERLFVRLMCLIIGISCCNMWTFMK